jgi:hypothetical protein
MINKKYAQQQDPEAGFRRYPVCITHSGRLTVSCTCGMKSSSSYEVHRVTPTLRAFARRSGKGEKNEHAENKQYFVCILCGDNVVMRRINTILAAQIAEKEKYVFIH